MYLKHSLNYFIYFFLSQFNLFSIIGTTLQFFLLSYYLFKSHNPSWTNQFYHKHLQPFRIGTKHEDLQKIQWENIYKSVLEIVLDAGNWKGVLFLPNIFSYFQLHTQESIPVWHVKKESYSNLYEFIRMPVLGTTCIRVN